MVGVRGGYSDYVSATAVSYPRRMLAFARFALAACAAALRGPRPDVVYATSPPLTMALPALAAAARWRAPLVFEVRDLWPEAPIQMGALRHPLARRLARALERFVYRRAARVIALSPGIRAGVIAAGAAPERVELVPNAADLDLFRPAPPPERFRVSYFGTMGEANDLGAVLEAARRLEDVEFVLMGDGKHRAALERSRPGQRELPGPGGGQGRGGRAGRRLERLPDRVQGRARAGHQLAEQAVRHLRRGPPGRGEHGRLDARAGGATTRPASTCARAT